MPALRSPLLTTGGTLSQLPLGLPLAKMLVLGTLLQTPDAMLTMAAGLAAPSPLSRLQPARDGSPHPAILTRRRLLSPMGDAFTMLHVHDAWVEARGTGEDGRRWCRRHGPHPHPHPHPSSSPSPSPNPSPNPSLNPSPNPSPNPNPTP